MTAVHPELDTEQGFVDTAYALLDRGLADAELNFSEYSPSSRSTAQAMKKALDILRNSRGSGQLVFGRMDGSDGTPLYIGRRRVYDANRDLAVIGWHAPAAQAFYEATPDDPLGLTLKRVFVEENRRLRRVIDEIVRDSLNAVSTGGAESAAFGDALLAELDRSRDGAMREVVATIQAEQFRIIRAERNCALVVQGGPGTGKTVVGLHRAAWLAFNHEDMRREGMLVVAPSSAFLSYISGVLPSLDVSDITQLDLPSLYAGEARLTGSDDPSTARVKGSVEMARLLGRALNDRIGWSQEELELSLGPVRIRIEAAEIHSLLDEMRGRDLPHNEARDVLRLALSNLAFRRYSEFQRESGRPVVASEATIRRLSSFTNALDRMWPSFTPEELLRSLYGTQSWLVSASEGILASDERARLYRPVQPTIAAEPWTADDLFCLDELSHLLNGEAGRYAHVVVDESQDLSPMQARALARRCPAGSFTVLGDLAQATGVWVRDDWAELTQHLTSGEVRVETLSVGYRVPAEVLELAARQLPLISPGLRASRSVRSGLGNPTATRVSSADLLKTALELANADVDCGLTTALVVPDGRYDDALAACRAADLRVGAGRDGDFALPLTVVPASMSKGLEFDSVVLLAPDEIVAADAQGRRTLYVAMTRCTQALRLVHAEDLPAGLDHLSPADLPDAEMATGRLVEDSARSAPDHGGEPPLAEMITLLPPDDLRLVHDLVCRLLLGGSAQGDPLDDRSTGGQG